jgi:hypothetical protein
VPDGPGQFVTINDVANEIARRLTRLFLKIRKASGPRSRPSEARDRPALQDYLLFHEYFHGDTGRGLGASHQTGLDGIGGEAAATAARSGRSSETSFLARPARRHCIVKGTM